MARTVNEFSYDLTEADFLHFDENYQTSLDANVEVVKELKNGIPSTLLCDWDRWNAIVGGFRPHEFSILCGSTGCLSGNTIIRLHRNGKGFELPIQDVYAQWNGFFKGNQWDLTKDTFVRSFDGVGIRLHKIKDVMLSGIKETVLLRTNQNHQIRLTKCHKILTDSGWKPASDLKIGEKIAADTLDARKRKGAATKKLWDSYFGGIKFHPYATNCNSEKRLVKHRAVYEANLNSLSLENFLITIRKNQAESRKLKFIDPSKFHIHHKNENHYDNSVGNLEALSIADHQKHHGDYKNFNQGVIRWVKIVSVDSPATEAVYDIECEHPHHNFVANGLVVHNSGKTTLIANMSAQLVKSGVKHFVMAVETGKNDFVRRVVSILSGRDFNTGDKISHDDLVKYAASSNEYMCKNHLMLSRYENRAPLEDLMRHLLIARNKHGAKIAFVDNLNFFLDVVSDSNSTQEMDRVIHELIIFCKKIDMHIVMIMHPKKPSHAQDTRIYSEFDIKGSSTAVQEAQNIFFWNRPHPDDVKTLNRSKFDREFKINKMRRRGRFVGSTIVFKFENERLIEHDVVE